MDSYYGHEGSIYNVKCNPFVSDVFLTAGEDWNCNIWHSKWEKALLTLKSVDIWEEIFDIDWNPFCSTSFGSVCKDGRIEFWDF